MALSTPVAFLIFKRPDTTEKVFESIRQAKPKKLLVIADGARPDKPGEAEKCAATRAIIDRVDWDCEVLRNFSDTNLGCRKRVSSGLDWVFSEVEEAIVLEDDCLPSQSFFNFCNTLLERYRDDERVTMIGGSNLQLRQSRTEYSYYFSKYMHIWGWATWRRAWRNYDVEMKTWSEYKKLDLIKSTCEDPYEQKFWTDVFEQGFNGAIDTWDYQWVYACWSQSGLSIIPDVNLISNIGFGVDATHTFSSETPWANLPTSDLEEIKHPLFTVRNREADTYTFEHHYGGKGMREADLLIPRIKRKLKAMKRLVAKSSSLT